MQWTEITISTTTDCAEIIAQILVDCGSYGAAIRDRHDLDQMQRPEGFWDMIDEAPYDQLGQDARVTGYFRQDASLGDHLSALHARLEELSRIDLGGIETGSLELTSGELSEQDWANAWRKYYKPTPIGEHLVIKPTWEQYQPRPGDHAVDDLFKILPFPVALQRLFDQQAQPEGAGVRIDQNQVGIGKRLGRRAGGGIGAADFGGQKNAQNMIAAGQRLLKSVIIRPQRRLGRTRQRRPRPDPGIYRVIGARQPFLIDHAVKQVGQRNYRNAVFFDKGLLQIGR